MLDSQATKYESIFGNQNATSVQKYLIGIGWTEDFDKSNEIPLVTKNEIDIVKLGKISAIFHDPARAKDPLLRRTHHKLVVECCRSGTFLPMVYAHPVKIDEFIKDLRKNHQVFINRLVLMDNVVEIVFYISWTKSGMTDAKVLDSEVISGQDYLKYRKKIQKEIATVKTKLADLKSLQLYSNANKRSQNLEHLIFSETAPDELTGLASLPREFGQTVALKLEGLFQEFCATSIATKVSGPMPPYYMARQAYSKIIENL